MYLTHPLQARRTGHLRHIDVQNHEVDALSPRLKGLQRFRSVSSDGDVRIRTRGYDLARYGAVAGSGVRRRRSLAILASK